MTEITDLSPTDSSNTSVTGESLDGSIANMGRMDNTLQAVMGLLARSIRTNVFRIIDFADPTKRIKWNLTGLPTATERELTAPYYSGTLGLVSDIIGYVRGLDVTKNVTDPTNDVDMAAGSAVDSTGTTSILLAAGLTKRVDATWVAGTNQGGRFYTTLIDGAIYIYIIRNPTTGVVDWGYSDSATNPTGGASYPAGFTQYRGVAALVRAAGVNGIPYWLDDRAQNGTFTPAITASAGTFTSVNATMTYTKVGPLIAFVLEINIVNAGTASSSLICTLPFITGPSFGIGGVNATNGNSVNGNANAATTSMNIARYDGTSIIATGAVIRMCGVYRQ